MVLRPSSCSQTAHDQNVLGPCAQVDGLQNHPRLCRCLGRGRRIVVGTSFARATRGLGRPSLDARLRRPTPLVLLRAKQVDALGPCAQVDSVDD